MLVPHKLAFGIDFPQSFKPLVNPEPNRFVGAYKGQSLAAAYSFDDLAGRLLTNRSWSKQEQEHFLRAPGSLSKEQVDINLDLSEPVLDINNEDLRYRALAARLTKGSSRPLESVKRIIDYLNKESIYTLNPNHPPNPEGDSVAPYLFGVKKRGFCVHFSHAATYLFRLSGIPARIGTGYATDLSYAKDGHVLLMVGDRHAWPEIFVEGLGWVVVDINAEQVEGEVQTPPDPQMLEDLMNKLDDLQEQELTGTVPEDDTANTFRKTLKAIIWGTVVVISFAQHLPLYKKVLAPLQPYFAKNPKTTLYRCYRAYFANSPIEAC